MTVKEAILTLNANVIIACERAGFDSATVKMIEDALDVIEIALQAQEPVEPIYGLGIAKCRYCNREIDKYDGIKYCPSCGQAVKWGG